MLAWHLCASMVGVIGLSSAYASPLVREKPNGRPERLFQNRMLQACSGLAQAECWADTHIVLATAQWCAKAPHPVACLAPTKWLFGARSGLPRAECRANPCTVLATTRWGGHCAHLQVPPHCFAPVRSADAPAGETEEGEERRAEH